MSEDLVTDPQPAKSMSFPGRVAAVFYRPSRAFESLAVSGVKFVDWFAPLALMIIIGCASSYIQLATPNLRTQIIQQRDARIDKAVEQGKISAGDGTREREMVEENISSGSISAVVVRIFAVAVVLLVTFFIMSLIWYLIGKLGFNSRIDYAQAMAINGLSNWITSLGMVIAIAVSIIASRIDGGVQVGMLVKMDPQNTTYALLSNINFFTLWSLAVVATGIGFFTGKKWARPAVWVYGTWIIWIFVSVGFTNMFFG